MTPDQLIGKYIALRDKVKDIKKQQEEVLKPYEDAMEKIEQIMLGQLKASNTDSIACKGIGTAYKMTKMQVGMEERQLLTGYVLGAIAKTANEAGSEEEFYVDAAPFLDCFTNSVDKNWVKDFMEQHDRVPPGVKVTTFAAVGFRKS